MGDPGLIPGSGRSTGEVLGSFNGLGPGSPEVTIRKVKERKRLIPSGLRREPIKSLTQHLHLSRRHWAPSQGEGSGGEGTGCLLERVLEAQTGEWARWVSALQRISRGERERQKERKTRGPKLWWSKGALLAEIQAYISLVRWLLSYYTGWNFINSHIMDSLIHTRLLTLKRVTACLIPWPQSWKLHAALLILGIETDKEQRILEK